MNETIQPVTKRFGERLIRLRTFLRLLSFAFLLACLLAILAALRIPSGLWVFIIPATLFLIWVLIKFIGDNVRLARTLGRKRIVSGIFMTFIAFIPMFAILVPGFMLGNYVANQANLGIQKLQAWSAPDRISEEIKREILESVEKTSKKYVPWYYRPLVWTGQIKDYERIVTNEVRIITEKVEKSKPKSIHIRAAAEFGKTLLLFFSVYSTTWMLLLFLRAFASLFGRIVVAAEPPLQFDMRPSRYPKSAMLDDGFAGGLAVGTDLYVKLDENETLFVRRTNEPANAIPSAGLRLKSGAFLLRLRRGLVFLTKIQREKSDEAIHFHGSGGNHYASAILAEGQQIAVNPDHLIGFSKSIRFFSHYDFSLAMLSMHRGVSLVTSGPGRLIVSVSGRPGIHDTAANTEMIYMDKLVIFGMDAKFEIRAASGIVDYYASGCVVRPLTGTIFVCAPGAPPGRNMFGILWSLIKQVYLPI